MEGGGQYALKKGYPSPKQSWTRYPTFQERGSGDSY